MKNLRELFSSLRRIDLSNSEVQDSLYRISDWLSDDEKKESDLYVQQQLKFLENFIKNAEKNNQIFYPKTDIPHSINELKLESINDKNFNKIMDGYLKKASENLDKYLEELNLKKEEIEKIKKGYRQSIHYTRDTITLEEALEEYYK